jgi:antibiotic biosynthesis monooxygenase (ABM) superfamily enzyme
LVVLWVAKWEIHPDKLEAYLKWTQSGIKRSLAVPGVVEFRAYRGLAGTPQAQITLEFADLAAWAAWRSNEEVQKVVDELYTLALNVTTELWGPSPVVPKPIRPGR